MTRIGLVSGGVLALVAGVATWVMAAEGQDIPEGLTFLGAPVTADLLRTLGLVKKPGRGVRLLAKGELKAGLNIEVARASKAAVAAVEKVGGKVTETEPKPEKAPAAGSEAES